jgi:hypothetical protein
LDIARVTGALKVARRGQKMIRRNRTDGPTLTDLVLTVMSPVLIILLTLLLFIGTIVEVILAKLKD